MANKPIQSITYPGLSDTYTFTQLTTDLTEAGKAPDAKVVGDRFDQNETNITDLQSNEFKAYATDTATGTVASFTDGADDIPMKDVTVQIEPVQDLHGYDNPWPAGGGKNKLICDNVTDYSRTVNDVVFTVEKNSEGAVLAIKAKGTASARTMWVLNSNISNQLPSGEYILSGCPSGGGSGKYRITSWDDTVGKTLANDYGSGATFTVDDTHAINCAIDISNGQAIDETFYPMLRLSSVSDATYEPYSNICPISGWTGVNVQRTGKNLVPITNSNIVAGEPWTVNYITFTPYLYPDGSVNKIVANGTASARTTFTLNDTFASSLENGIYIVSGCPSGGGNSAYRITIWDVTDSVTIANDYGTGSTFTLDNTHSIIYAIDIQNGQQVSNIEFRPMIRRSTVSDATYEPYSGQTYPITFPTEAGTVYGGTLDITTGVLTVDKANIASYNGETLPSTWISDRDVYSTGTTPTTGAQVVYELAEPITYQLTPQEIRSLLGTNNILADTGDTTVEYRADTKLYITKQITEAVNALS